MRFNVNIQRNKNNYYKYSIFNISNNKFLVVTADHLSNSLTIIVRPVYLLLVDIGRAVFIK